MLLLGRATLDAHGRRLDGSHSGLEVLMVAIHDHKMRFVGQHCLVVDRTREKALESQVDETHEELGAAHRRNSLSPIYSFWSLENTTQTV
jgi:hypothetical protein